jgi:hypothetical protein
MHKPLVKKENAEVIQVNMVPVSELKVSFHSALLRDIHIHIFKPDNPSRDGS